MIETLRDFVDKMNGLGIEYMVTGSYAMSAYGEIRMTKDIDVVVEISSTDVASFFEVFRQGYYVSNVSIRRAIDRRSMFNVVSNENGAKIDCIIQKDTDFARTSFTRRYKVKVAGIEYWNTTREDLIVAKLQWAKDTHSEMQIRDIANLTATSYDADYVGRWIEELGLKEVWEEVGKWKIQHKPLAN
jgi:predicted nuclease of predicted toxin-antitoxin system